MAYDGEVIHRVRHDLVDGPVAELLTDLQARGHEVPEGNDLVPPITVGTVRQGYARAVAAAHARTTYIELPGVDPTAPIESTIGIAGVVRYDDCRPSAQDDQGRLYCWRHLVVARCVVLRLVDGAWVVSITEDMVVFLDQRGMVTQRVSLHSDPDYDGIDASDPQHVRVDAVRYARLLQLAFMNNHEIESQYHDAHA
jgi:hypothetical protein